MCIYVLRFIYRERGAATRRIAPSRAAPLRIERPQISPATATIGIAAARSCSRLSAWDDGVQTHLRFDPRRELPAVFVRNDDGSESLLNFHIDHGELIAHRLARQLHRSSRRLGWLHRQPRVSRVGERAQLRHVAPEVERRHARYPMRWLAERQRAEATRPTAAEVSGERRAAAIARAPIVAGAREQSGWLSGSCSRWGSDFSAGTTRIPRGSRRGRVRARRRDGRTRAGRDALAAARADSTAAACTGGRSQGRRRGYG